jgi:uncharacterized protein (DUF2345 family)
MMSTSDLQRPVRESMLREPPGQDTTPGKAPHRTVPGRLLDRTTGVALASATDINTSAGRKRTVRARRTATMTTARQGRPAPTA